MAEPEAPPLPQAITRVLIGYRDAEGSGALGLKRELAGLGCEVATAGPGLEHDLPPGASLAALIQELDPAPELYLHLATPGDEPPAGLDHLEIPAVACGADLPGFDHVVPAGTSASELLALAQARPSRGLALLAGHQHAAAGDFTRAIACFEQAARHARPSVEALVNLGVCLHAMGNLDEAVALFEAALAADPGNQGARENLKALGHEPPRPVPKGLLEREVPAYFSWVRPEVAAMVPPDARRVLDVGCAAGALGAKLKEDRPGLEVAGIESDQLAAMHAARRLDAVLQGSVETMPLPFEPGYFDCLVLADVLEHLVEPEQALQRLLPLVRDGGTVAISLPNVRHYEVVGDLLRDGRFTYQEAGILDRTHLRFYTYHEIERWMARAGLELVMLSANRGVADPDRFRAMQAAVEALGGSAAGFRHEGGVIQYLLQLRKPAAGTRVPVGARRPVKLRPLAPLDAPPVASLVILACNQLAYTRQCLDSVFTHASVPLELILVDNGSTDGTAAYFQELAAADPRVQVVTNPSNLGFARGCNQGLARARGDVVVLLNNDAVVTAGWLEGLLAPLQDPGIGAAGACTNQIHGTQCLPFVPYADDMHAMAEFAAWLAQAYQGMGMGVVRLTGFCLAVRRDVVQRIGGLDPGFGLGNFEDDDFSLRIQTAGFKLWQCGDVFVHHFGSATFKGERLDYDGLLERNWQYFCSKWGLPAGSRPEAGHGEALARLAFDPARDVVPLP